MSPRPPRHEGVVNDHVEVWVQRALDGETTPLAAEIVNISRQGAQFQCGAPLLPNETVLLLITAPVGGLQLRLSCKILWRRRDEDSEAWRCGGLFEAPLAYEQLGELFLNDVLRRDPVKSRS